MSNRLKFAWLPEETATGDRNAGPAGGFRKFLRAYLAQLRGRSRALLAIVAGAWAVAAAVILSLPVSYTGVATVMIGLAADRTGEVDATVRTIDSEIELIRSRALAEGVVHRLRLASHGELATASGHAGIVSAIIDHVFAARAALDGLNETERLDRIHQIVVSRFLDRLHVARRGRSLVVEISYRSRSPEVAAAAANAVAEAYLALRVGGDAGGMARRLSALRDKADASERAIGEVRRREAAARNGGQAQRSGRVEALKGQISELRTQRSQAEALLDRVEAMQANADVRSVAAVLSTTKLRALMEQDAALRGRAMEIATASDGQDPRLVEVRRALARIRDGIRAENERVVQGLRNRINVALGQENALRVTLDRIERENAGAAGVPSPQLVALQDRAASDRARYANFLKTAMMADKSAASDHAEPRLLSAAEVPLGPSPARTIADLGLALLLSCAGGLALAGVAMGLDRGFRSLQQIEEDTGMPTLGLVPRIPKRGLRGMNPPDYILENPVSAYSESIRSLYTAILLSNVETPPKVLMVASAAPDEGKTSLALSFARMVGRIGQKRVVLVDCDTRHPQVHRKLGLEASPGLVEYLAGEATLEEVLQVDAKTNALVIAAGRKPSNSVELLTSDRFADLLSKLSAACDLVILDSSPVLAISDARILARLVDKTIFVARWARTRRELVLRGIKNLTDAGADVAGIALTRVDVRKHARFGFGDSGMYHGAYRRYYSG